MNRLAISLLLGVLLAGCGFHLRGPAQIPFKSLVIALPDTSPFRAELARTITSSSATRIVDDPKEADAVLSVLTDRQAKNILSTNSAGQVTEYELVRTFVFQVTDSKGEILIPPSQIVMRRSETFSPTEVLSKQAEEVLLWRDMQTDLEQQLLRRMAAAKAPEAP